MLFNSGACLNVIKLQAISCVLLALFPFIAGAMSNFAMGTILGKGFPQALVHTVHSTCACGKPFPKIVPMAKLDILLKGKRTSIFVSNLK